MQPGMPPRKPPLIYLLAGEASGDVLGARLMAALATLHPGVTFAGVGGPRMAEQGLDTLFPLADLAVMGIVEVIPASASSAAACSRSTPTSTPAAPT